MNSRIVWISLACIVIGVIAPTAVMGYFAPAVYTWTGEQDSTWGDSRNWFPAVTPGAAHVAVIPKVKLGYPTHLDPILTADTDVGWLRIEADGKLTTDAYTLTVSNSGGLALDSGGVLIVSAGGKVVFGPASPAWLNDQRHVVDGTIVLEAPADEEPGGILDSGLGHLTVLSGGGKIVGKDPDARIIVGKRLWSEITIQGALAIRSESDARTGTFENHGLVHARRLYADQAWVEGDITIDWLGMVRGSGEWRVGDGPPFADTWAEMTFGRNLYIAAVSDHPLMSGDFNVLGGTLTIESSVSTSGHVHHYKGKIEVAAGKQFKAN